MAIIWETGHIVARQGRIEASQGEGEWRVLMNSKAKAENKGATPHWQGGEAIVWGWDKGQPQNAQISQKIDELVALLQRLLAMQGIVLGERVHALQMAAAATAAAGILLRSAVNAAVGSSCWTSTLGVLS